MAIKISKSLIEKLPENEVENIKEVLWDKAANKCFLCSDDINEAGEDVVPVHDKPEAEKGETEVITSCSPKVPN